MLGVVVVVAGLVAIFAIPIFRTHDRDAKRITQLVRAVFQDLAKVVRAMRRT